MQCQVQIQSGNRYNNYQTIYRYPRREFVKKIIESESFLDLQLDAMKLLLAMDELAAKEDDIWTELLKWSEKQAKKVVANDDDEKEVSKHKVSLLKEVKTLVRFGLMTPQCFAKSVQPQMVLEAQEMIAIFTYLCGNQANGCGKFCIEKRKGV